MEGGEWSDYGPPFLAVIPALEVHYLSAVHMGVAPFNRDSGTLRGKRRIWVVGRRFAQFCTWLQWLPADSTPSYGISTSDS